MIKLDNFLLDTNFQVKFLEPGEVHDYFQKFKNLLIVLVDDVIVVVVLVNSDLTPSFEKIGICILPPYNVGSVLWRLFSTLEVVHFIGGIASVLWGIASVLWKLLSTVENSFSTVEVVQYSAGGIISTAGNNISTVGDNISTVEGIHYSGERF